MARPNKSEKEKLTERVAFRMTKDTYAEYIQRVRSSGLTPSEFFRTAVTTNATQIVAKASISKDNIESLRLLKNMANNTNQIAKALNTALLSGLVGDGLCEQLLIVTDKYLALAKEIQADVN